MLYDKKLKYKNNKCIHELFEDTAKKNKDKIALIYEDQQLSYEALNIRANQLAHYLKTLKLKVNATIGICIPRSLDMVVAVLGVLKINAIYVPIDPNYSEERIVNLLQNSNLDALLTTKKLVKIFKVYSKPLIIFEEINEWEKLKDTNISNIPFQIKSSNIACIMYTSGSTGEPKGVMLTHSGIINHYCWINNKYPIAQNEVFCQKSRLNVVDSFLEIFDALFRGIRLVILPPEHEKNPESMLKELKWRNITRCMFVPSFLNLLIEEYSDELKELHDLKYVFVSGEPCPLSLVKKFFSILPEANIINLYGATEVTATVIEINYKEYVGKEVGKHFKANIIGRPLTDQTTYILNHKMDLQLFGDEGELYIGGAGLAEGYFNKPALTAEKFVPNPFGEGGSRLYRTGDLGRYLPDGNIEYLGRIDHQVKLRGFRIELGEVENALSSYEGVKQSVVLAREHHLAEGESAASRYLVGYYVANSKLDEAEILRYLQSKLPDYMVPSALVHLEKLPLTINGKLDRRALPEPEFTNSAGYMAPRNEVESQVCQIWAEVLRLPESKVGIQDDFFRLGGDSILAMKLVSKINKVMNANIDIANVFETRTITRLINNYMIIRKDNYIIGERYEF